MKKIFVYGALCFCSLLFSKAHAQSNFSIQGSSSPEIYPLLWVCLQYENEAGKMVRDTCKIRDGLFYFSGQLSGPQRVTFYLMPDTSSALIKVKRMVSQPVVIDPSKMQLKFIHNSNFRLTGSALHDEERRFHAMYMQGLSVATPVEKSMVRKRLMYTYVKENPTAVLSLLLLKEYTEFALRHDSITALFATIPLDLQASKIGHRIRDQLSWLSILQPGDQAPLFVLPDTKGVLQNSESLRGSYVLLHFWATWCSACRVENRHLVKAKQELTGLPVQFVGISLDHQKDLWKKAIDKDQLNWMQLIEAHVFESQLAKDYGIKSLPRTFLIDPTGKIIAMDIRQEAIVSTIQQALR